MRSSHPARGQLLPSLLLTSPSSPGVWLSIPTWLTDQMSWSCRREKGSASLGKTTAAGCGACPSSRGEWASSPATTSLLSSGLVFLTRNKNIQRGERVTCRIWGLLVPTEKSLQGIPAVLTKARDSLPGQDDTWQVSLLLFLRVPTQLHAPRGNRISLQQPGAIAGRSQGAEGAGNILLEGGTQSG